MKQIKVFGPGCAKCKATYNNVLEALQKSNVEAQVEKVEDLEEMMRYQILTTPVVMIDEKVMIKGRVAQVSEIIELIKN